MTQFYIKKANGIKELSHTNSIMNYKNKNWLLTYIMDNNMKILIVTTGNK